MKLEWVRNRGFRAHPERGTFVVMGALSQLRGPRRFPRLAALGVLLCTGLLWTGTANAGDEAIDPANDAHEEGLSLAKKGDSEGARAAFLRSLGHRRMPKTLLNLCVIEHRLGHEPEAMGYCNEYTDGTEDREKVAVLRAGLMKDISLRLGRVAIDAPAGETIEVDGKAIAKAPLGRPLSVWPGWHDIKAGPTVKRVLVRIGETSEVDLLSDSAPIKMVMGPVVGDKPSATPEPRQGTWLAPAVLFGTTVTALGVGIGLALASNGRAAAYRDEIALAAPGKPCVNEGDPQPSCQRVRDAINEGNNLTRGAIAAYTMAGTLGVITILTTLFLKPWRDAPAAPPRRVPAVPTPPAPPEDALHLKSLRLSPMLGPTSGVVVGGSF